MTSDMDVARLTGAARMCPQSNKSILPTFVLSKVGISYTMKSKSQRKVRKCPFKIQNSKFKIQKINANNKTHPTYPTHPKSAVFFLLHHLPLPSAYLN